MPRKRVPLTLRLRTELATRLPRLPRRKRGFLPGRGFLPTQAAIINAPDEQLHFEYTGAGQSTQVSRIPPVDSIAPASSHGTPFEAESFRTVIASDSPAAAIDDQKGVVTSESGSVVEIGQDHDEGKIDKADPDIIEEGD